jgi:hypothetical protein
MLRWPVLAVLAACDSSGSLEVTTDDPDASDEATEPACDNPVTQWLPADGAEEVDYHTRLAGELTTADETAEITVSTEDGEVAGGSRVDGLRVIFTPEVPLEGGLTYTLKIDHACGTETASFTVSKFNWSLDLASGDIVSPSALELLRDQLVPVFFGVDSRTDRRWNFIGVVGDDTGVQDVCNETIALPPATYDAPNFHIGPGDWALTVSGFQVQIRDYDLQGTFSDDWETMDNVNLTGNLDLRDIEDVAGIDAGTICGIAALSGSPCEECGSPSGKYCVDIDIRDIEGVRQSWPVVPRTLADVQDDPTCQ